MLKHALFRGLIFDENDALVETASIGEESFYIVDDCGFKRHIPSEEIDREILKVFTAQIPGNEEYLANEAARMTGQNDLFSMAILRNAFKNIDKQVDLLFETGLPEDAISMLGMTGFKVTINYHGEIVHMELPSRPESEE